VASKILDLYSELFQNGERFLDEVFGNQVELLSIGQMIEFLMEHHDLEDGYDVICKSWGPLSLGYFTGEYCDHLWQAVKEVLEK